VRLEFDRAYDLRVLAALPSTLGLFEPEALRAQIGEMTKQRRAICFTLMAPVSRRAAAGACRIERGVATVLVCLHVAPALAREGLEAVLSVVEQAAQGEGEPVHELAAPIPEAEPSRAGFYREAIYVGSAASITITTHSPPRLPPEAMHAVSALIDKGALHAVTTIAVAPRRATSIAAHPSQTAAPSPTLH
jgi:hypothetical protein